MTQETNATRRKLLRGALTASAAAAAAVFGGSEAWATRERLRRNRDLRLRKRPERLRKLPPLRAKRLNFRHSRFSGRLGGLSPQGNVDQLITRIARRTRLKPEQVHQVLSLAYPSTEQFVLRKYAANPQALNKQLSRASAGSPIAIVSPV